MSIHSKIIASVKDQFSDRFRVFDNTESDKKVVGGQFPDIILMRPEPPPNSDILFIMKIETINANLVDSVSEWKALGSAPSVFYIVVPKEKLDQAKKLVSATNVRARFAFYEMEGDILKQIQYE